MIKNSPANAGDLRDASSIPGRGRYLGEGNGNPLQYFCLENPMDRGAWRATVYGVARVEHDLATKPPPIKDTVVLTLLLFIVLLRDPLAVYVSLKIFCPSFWQL